MFCFWGDAALGPVLQTRVLKWAAKTSPATSEWIVDMRGRMNMLRLPFSLETLVRPSRDFIYFQPL